jgi:hypothetical protein
MTLHHPQALEPLVTSQARGQGGCLVLLDHMSGSMWQGQVTGVLGPSGCGTLPYN